MFTRQKQEQLMKGISTENPYQAVLPDSAETGQTGIMHLKRFWAKGIARRNGLLGNKSLTGEFSRDRAVLWALGLNLGKTMHYLLNTAPDFETFERWVLQQCGGSVSAETVNTFNRVVSGNTNKISSFDEQVLTAADHAFFQEHGFLVLKNAVPREDALAAAGTIWQCLDADPHDPKTWYKPFDFRNGIMLELFHHETFERNRRSPRIRQAYTELYGHVDLFVTTDRVSFNPPESGSWKFNWPNLHWDVSLKQPIPFGLQGLLYLTDTVARQGAFSVVPGFHRSIGTWLAQLPPGTDPHNAIVHHPEVHAIAARAGDFVLWHHALPHGSGPNMTQLPRFVQYINWLPADMELQDEWL